MEPNKVPKKNKIAALIMLGIAVILMFYLFDIMKEKEQEKVVDKTAIENYVLKPTDTVGNSMQIANKLGGMIMGNKLNEMIAIATANIKRFEGADKASILDQRGGAYSMKQDYENAAKDYAMAAELDPTELVHQTNAAESYQSLGNKEKALDFANKVKNNPKASKSDLETVNAVINALK
jgi:tetratricopeptide (TPR) repeat protein